MAMQRLTVRPGINTELSQLLNESGFSFGQFIRFFQGLLQKLGGWTRLISTPVLGTARAMLSWQDANANQYLAIGSEQGFQVYFNGVLYNVTPVSATDNITPSFTTTLNSTSVKVTDASNIAAVGNFINVVNDIAVGGLILEGSYQIQTVIDANNYTITSAVPATANATNTGAAALFTTTNTSPNVQVTLAKHGLVAGGVFTVYVSTTVATIVLFGSYTVATVIDVNNFTIVASSNANASTTGSENGGNVQIQYLLPSGPASSSNQGGLYGEGPYGQGAYSFGVSQTFVSARLWSFGYWGTDIIASFTNGGVYTWISENDVINNPAVLIATAPLNVAAGIFTAMPQQQAIALGASDGSSADPDPMLVRWSDIADNTDWTASATNQAGSFRIPRGSRIVGGLQGPQCGIIWTDVGVWLMQYIGFPLVYSFIEIGQGCGLIGQNAKAVLAGRVEWMSLNQFFVYDGNSVQPLPCTVWDKVFQNLTSLQQIKITACPNSYFNEMSYCYPSASGAGENDTRVTYAGTEQTWTADPTGAIVRTAWLDQSAFAGPLGIDQNGLIQQHEMGPNNDTAAMVSYAQTGFFKISEGLDYTFIERLLPDFVYENNATLQITLYFQDYPNQTNPFVVGPLTATQAVNYLIVRGRGRLVSIKIGSSDLGSFWRLGEILYQGSVAGRR